MAEDQIDQSTDLDAQPEEEQQQEYDPSNPGHVGERNKKARERKVRVRDGFKQLLSTRNGRAWLWDLIGQQQPFGTIFTQADPLVLAYNAGRKDVALELLAQLNKKEHIEDYRLMMQEATE